MKKIVILTAAFIAVAAKSQILTNSAPVSGITNSSVILDASTNYSAEAGESNNKHKGIVIPSVDLVKFEFDLSLANGITFPTYFDGMIVYNRATGTTLTSGNRSSTATAVSPGYYYFYNPNGASNGNVKGGEWRAMGGMTSIGADTTNDAWINEASTNAVKLGTKSDGTARAAGADFVAKDDGSVGIGTNLPKATLDVTANTRDGSKPEGFIAPRLTGDEIKAGDPQYDIPQTGTIVYATSAPTNPKTFKTSGITEAGYYYFDGAVWKSLGMGNTNIPSVVADCNMNGFTGSYTNGTAMTAANKFTVTITNNSFSTATIAFQASDLIVSGIPGITVASVTPSTATLISGQSQLVEYTLSGTPTSSGTLTGSWTKLVLNCSKTVTVIQPPITSLDCAGAVKNGVLVRAIEATGVSFVIGYGGGDGSAYSGQTISSTGVTGLTATLAAGNFAVGAGSLTYTVTGTPASAGTASFAINIGGKSCTLTIPVSNAPTITCGSITQSPAGALVSNTAYTGTYTLSYTGATVGAGYPAQTFTVNGLTLQRSAGTFTSASGTITYNLSGTYTGANNGIVTFNPSLAGTTCNVVYGDALRGALSTAGCASCNAYDAAGVNDWVQITATEYAAIANTANVPGSYRIGQANAQMNTSSLTNPFSGHTVVSNDTDARVPANSYVIGFSLRTASGNGSGNRVKVSASQKSGFVNMGNAFSIRGGGRVYFVCKRPTTTTPNTSGNGYFGSYVTVTTYSTIVGSNTYWFNYPSGGNVSSVNFRQNQWGGSFGVFLQQGITTTTKSW
ncbi:hypothetical protein [Chryseobacterium profundimaris]|uniref:Uncharacterized protein n=1 Tax=Chryseobacterium profundimaris TaxID=1387275 RepID=A0ABY1N8Y5_9FLAO|nr:hypothetical protein [Chryseobacterium profundimaris]SMP03634.1 hypothetical protein SAMN06264346_101213 [Chryseobacterium profundimaris]